MVRREQCLLCRRTGTISIRSPVEVGSITVLSDGYVLEGSGAITLGSPQTTIDVAAGSFTIDCGIAGGAVVKSGNGTLVLGGANSYSNSMTVSGHAVAGKRLGPAR